MSSFCEQVVEQIPRSLTIDELIELYSAANALIDVPWTFNDVVRVPASFICNAIGFVYASMIHFQCDAIVDLVGIQLTPDEVVEFHKFITYFHSVWRPDSCISPDIVKQLVDGAGISFSERVKIASNPDVRFIAHDFEAEIEEMVEVYGIEAILFESDFNAGLDRVSRIKRRYALMNKIKEVNPDFVLNVEK